MTLLTDVTVPTALQQRTSGRLHLHFSQTDAPSLRTKLVVTDQQPPLRVIRAFPMKDGSVLTHLHNISGGILGGDQLTLSACLGESTQVQLTSTGATRVYRHRENYQDAFQQTHFVIGKGALLEYLPDPLIPFAGARFQQQTRIELATGAGLFYWEVIAPGREAHDEIFAYDEVGLTLDIVAENSPIVLERMRLRPAQQSLTSLARMGDYRYFGTFYICKVGCVPAVWSALEQTLFTLAQQRTVPGEILWGVSTMPAHGMTVRALSMTNRAISDGFYLFWKDAKEKLYGKTAILPRKVY